MKYFSNASFEFFRQFKENNERDWFHQNRERYERFVRDPFLHLLTDLQPSIVKISPHFHADPKPVGGSMFRINRDTRFSKDKAPYKTWAGARIFHERHKETTTPAFYIHIAASECFVAGGIWHPESGPLRQIRSFILDNPQSWKSATQTAAFKKHLKMDRSESLKRAPHDVNPDHELIEDLKLKNFVALSPMDQDIVTSPRLAKHVSDQFERMAPMIDYLCTALDVKY